MTLPATMVASLASVVAGLLCLASRLGPYHGTASRFDPGAILLAWTNRRVRLAFAGYLGHMWELYVMWSWVGVAVAVSYRASLPGEDAEALAKLTAFAAIAAGGLASIAAGFAADRVGKANAAQWAVAISGTAAIAPALTFGGPPWRSPPWRGDPAWRSPKSTALSCSDVCNGSPGRGRTSWTGSWDWWSTSSTTRPRLEACAFRLKTETIYAAKSS